MVQSHHIITFISALQQLHLSGTKIIYKSLTPQSRQCLCTGINPKSFASYKLIININIMSYNCMYMLNFG